MTQEMDRLYREAMEGFRLDTEPSSYIGDIWRVQLARKVAFKRDLAGFLLVAWQITFLLAAVVLMNIGLGERLGYHAPGQEFFVGMTMVFGLLAYQLLYRRGR